MVGVVQYISFTTLLSIAAHTTFWLQYTIRGYGWDTTIQRFYWLSLSFQTALLAWSESSSADSLNTCSFFVLPVPGAPNTPSSSVAPSSTSHAPSFFPGFLRSDDNSNGWFYEGSSTVSYDSRLTERLTTYVGSIPQILVVDVVVCHRWSADSLFGLLELAVVVCVDGVAVCAEVVAADLAHYVCVLGGSEGSQV